MKAELEEESRVLPARGAGRAQTRAPVKREQSQILRRQRRHCRFSGKRGGLVLYRSWSSRGEARLRPPNPWTPSTPAYECV